MIRWWDHALCSGADPNIFFPAVGDDTNPAKLVCFRCPVQRDCLYDALVHNERFGTWGGLGTEARRALRRQMIIVEPTPVEEELCLTS